jgi:hypothetical protein
VCSTVRSFTTPAAPNLKPLKPVLLEPSANQTHVSKIPVFKVLGADPEGNTLTYMITLSLDAQLSNPMFFQASYPGWNNPCYWPTGTYAGVTASCQILNAIPNLNALVPGATYYWKATVYDSFQQSNESDVYALTTVPLPLAPAIVAPSNTAIITSKTPSLILATNSPTSGLLNYDVKLSSDNFQTILEFQSQTGGGWSKSSYASGEQAVLTIPAAYALVPGKTYLWRASAYDIDNDNWSPLTPNTCFTVITPPLQPQLVSPADNYSAPNSRLSLCFTAQSESGNTMTGRIELSQDHFATVWKTFDQAGDQTGWSAPVYASGETFTFTLPSSLVLVQGKTYAWRTRAWDGISAGAYSESRSLQLTNTLEIQKLKTIPNPAVTTTDLQIHLQLSLDADISIRFFNKIGKEIDHLQVSALGGEAGNIIHFDISKYASGVYFYLLEARSPFGSLKEIRKFAVVK